MKESTGECRYFDEQQCCVRTGGEGECPYFEIYQYNCEDNKGSCFLFLDEGKEGIDLEYNNGCLKHQKCKAAYQRAKSPFKTKFDDSLLPPSPQM
jgi:hypothetical protein